MIESIINLDQVDYTKEPMFMGRNLNLQRYDTYKYQFYYNSYQKQIGSFWKPEEYNLTKDRNDFNTLTDTEKEIFTRVLSYQILLDSSQNRVIPHLVSHVSLPEVELAFNTWSFFEQIHSYSYTYIIQNVYPEATQVFNDIMRNEEIIKRAKSTTKDYDVLLSMRNSKNIEEIKDSIFLTLIAVNILEGIKFYNSFACSYAFAENKKMEGNAKIISMINRDENLHLAITQKTLEILKNNKDEGFQEVWKRNEEKAREMYRVASEEEMDWARYLFSNGSLLGLTDTLLIEYTKWLTDKRMKTIGLEPLYKGSKNPFPWISGWTDSGSVQIASQETENETYRVSSVKNDLDEIDYSKF